MQMYGAFSLLNDNCQRKETVMDGYWPMEIITPPLMSNLHETFPEI